MSLFSSIKPVACTKSMLLRESDLQYAGSFSEIVRFHSYKINDEKNMQIISDILDDYLDEGVAFFKGYCDQIGGPNQKSISQNELQQYLHKFLHSERNEDYFQSLITFFDKLNECKYPNSKLITALNQLHFYFTTVLLSKKGMNSKKSLELQMSLQKAFNIEQQLLIDQSNLHFYEFTAANITELLQQNTEIMHMKDLLDMLRQEDVQIQNIKETSEELAVSVDEVAQHAVSVAESTEFAVDVSEKAQEVVGKAINKIILTNTEFEQIVSKVNELQTSVKKIEDVVNVINGISEQTNLLALNAAIEAARAGEAGRGFAVVAEEVRKLSDNNVNSLKTVKENVTTLQSVSKDIFNLTNHTKDFIDTSVADAKEAIPMLSDIINKMKDINDQTNGTAAIAEQQAAGVNEVANTMVNIAEISITLNELSNDTIHAIHKLSKMLSVYRDQIFTNTNQFSTRTLLQLAKSDHILWKWRIYNMLLGVEKVEPTDVNAHVDCRLGKWYFNPETKKSLGTNRNYQEIDQHHKMVHEYAKAAAIAYKENDIEKAESMFKGLEGASQQVILLLDKIIKDIRN